MTMTIDDADKAQRWQGMDGTTAWLVIERNAGHWDDVGAMMHAWLRANGGTVPGGGAAVSDMQPLPGGGDALHARWLDRLVGRARCWWFGCKIDPQDPAPAEYADCMLCGQNVSYSDAVGDTRHQRAMTWANYWLLRKWWPAKCGCCGRRWRCDETRDHLPF